MNGLGELETYSSNSLARTTSVSFPFHCLLFFPGLPMNESTDKLILVTVFKRKISYFKLMFRNYILIDIRKFSTLIFISEASVGVE